MLQKPMLLSGGYLAVLCLGYGFAGWLLAAFQVSGPIWLGTFAMSLHLIYSGVAAIVLSCSWVVLIMLVAAILKAWAPIWNSQIPLEQPQLWAKGLLFIWFGAIALIVLLAFARSGFNQLGWSERQSAYGLVLLIWSALGIGGLIYQAMVF